MRLVPIYTKDKMAHNRRILDAGGEGLMIKQADGAYIQKGRPKSMYKLKRREEIDAFVTGANPGKKDKGWELLIGDLEFSAYTESGKIHMVAKCSNMTIDERIKCSVCVHCGIPLKVDHGNISGKHVICSTFCTGCGRANAGAALNPEYLNRCAEITGQEWTARVYRLKHAVIERWRVTGEDAKSPDECHINLKNIQQRFQQAVQRVEL